MGVAGLWDILRPVGKTRSLTHLAVVNGFEANPDGKRGFRIGIDASIWFFHATYGREGENPELRTLFFRCTRLMSMPFLPLFVFDGPKRPEIKRGKRVSGNNHWMVQGMQEIINAFGFEWRMAPGEAEAELAYMNRIGVIDAVLSDDVDTFLFGALMVVRNPSTTLTGNHSHALKNASGKNDGNHVITYEAADFAVHPNIMLSQGGLILIGVLRGGDYNQGLSGCGVAIAHGLAKCGFGDTLLQAARTLSREQLLVFLNTWREELRQELRTNSQGHLPRKSPSLAKSIPNDFPNLDVLLSYTNPATSEAKGAASKNIAVDWDKEPDLGKVAALCEMYFEWGIKEIIIKRFRTVLWPCAVLRILRRSVLLADRRAARVAERASGAIPSTPKKSHRNQLVPVGTPSTMIARHFSCLQLGTPQHRDAGSDPFDDENPEEPLIVKIHSSRTHVSTDGVLEYRLEIAPAQLVRLCEAGVKGLRTAVPPELEESEDNVDDDEDDGSGAHKRKTKGKKPPPDPESHLRIWLPACMVRLVEPHLVEDFEETQRQKQAKKAGKATGRGTKSKTVSSPKSKSTKKGKAKVAPIAEEAEELSLSSATEDDIAQKPTKATTAKKTTGKPSTSAAVTTTVAARKARPDNLPQKVNDFFTASKVNRTKMSKPQSSTQRISTLFADFSSSGLQPHKRGKKTGHSVVDLDLSEDGSEDDLPHRPLAPPFPRIPSLTTSSRTPSSTSAVSSGTTSPSRLLSFLDSTYPLAPPQKSPPRPRLKPRPFPMSSDDFKPETHEDNDELSTVSSPSRTRRHSRVSSDSDCHRSTLPKSPRKSNNHSSPRNSPRKDKTREEGDRERAVSPSPARGRHLPPLTMTTRISPGRKAPRNGADTSVIEISSDSDSPPQLAPLLLAKAKAFKPAEAPRPKGKSSMVKVNAKPTGSSTQSRPKSNYEPQDIIDLT